MSNNQQELFEEILESIKSLDIIKNNEKIKIKSNKENRIVKIYESEFFGPLENAKEGLQDILELSYTTAEHHPYWGIIYHSSEIIKFSLDRWYGELKPEEIDEMIWRTEEIKYFLNRIKEERK